MKNLFLLLSFLFFTNYINAQVQFAPVGSHYYYKGTSFQEFPTPTTNHYIIDVPVVKDTMLNGKNCTVFQENCLEWGLHGSAVICYEEERRVYTYNVFTQAFDLLYDFNKQEGETWQVELYNTPGQSYDFTLSITVDSISYTQLNGHTIQVQHLSIMTPNTDTPYYRTVYEGIGCIEHLLFFPADFGLTTHNNISSLRCFDSSVDGLFQFIEEGEECGVLTSTDTPEEILAIDIYPNPATDQVTISVPAQANIVVYNTTGQVVHTQDNIPQHYTLPTPDYAPGVYWLKIHTQGQSISKKLIISHK